MDSHFAAQLQGYPITRLYTLEDQIEELARAGNETAAAKLVLIRQEIQNRKRPIKV
jgi:hypothetical protein